MTMLCLNLQIKKTLSLATCNYVKPTNHNILTYVKHLTVMPQTRGHNMSRSIPKTNIGIKYKKNIYLIYDIVKTKMDDNMPILWCWTTRAPIEKAIYHFVSQHTDQTKEKKNWNGVIHAKRVWKGRYQGHQPKSYFSLMKDNQNHNYKINLPL